MANPGGYSQFTAVFLTEAEENLQVLESGLLSLEENPSRKDELNTIFRAAHTIKGSAGLVGLVVLKTFTHKMEDLLEALRSGAMQAERGLVSDLLAGVDLIRRMIDNVKNEKPEGEGLDLGPASDRLQSHLGASAVTVAREKAPVAAEAKVRHFYFISIKHGENVFNGGLDPLLFLRDLADAGTIRKIRLDPASIPAWDGLNPEKFLLTWELFFESDKELNAVRDIFLFVLDEAELRFEELTQALNDGNRAHLEQFLIDGKSIDQRGGRVEAEPEERGTAHKAENATIRVDTEKLDRLLNMVSELVIAQSQITRLAQELRGSEGERLADVAASIEKLSRALQEQTMQLRMVDLAPVFHPFRRLVRDYMLQTGKQVRLEISGEETELDKNMIAHVSDPLKHLVRNAIDHGIETPEKRREAGKNETGTVRLRAYYEAGFVVIEVSDDGAGIRRSRLLAKARERGVVAPDATLTDDEILRLVFAPGLSTAEQITDISGRGVGMDVVLQNVKSLAGDIEIKSVEGQGSSFRLRLPLTLAIMDAMLVSCGGETFILPVSGIEESLRPAAEELKTVEGKGEVIRIRGQYVTLLRLDRILNIRGAQQDPTRAQVILLRSGNLRIALLVDRLLEQQQVVLKSLQANFTDVPGIASATILGDGRVALVLDVGGLLQMTLGKRH